jgi:hypothetical protein
MVPPAIKVLKFLDRKHSQSPSVNDTAGPTAVNLNLNF